MFLSAVWTHSDGTHSLQSIHWWAIDAMPHFSESNDSNLIYILDGLSMITFLENVNSLGELYF